MLLLLLLPPKAPGGAGNPKEGAQEGADVAAEDEEEGAGRDRRMGGWIENSQLELDGAKGRLQIDRWDWTRSQRDVLLFRRCCCNVGN